MKIDAYHHFWKYDSDEYGWIGEEMSVIRRDFLPGDLESEIKASGVDGVVSVKLVRLGRNGVAPAAGARERLHQRGGRLGAARFL